MAGQVGEQVRLRSLRGVSRVTKNLNQRQYFGSERNGEIGKFVVNEMLFLPCNLPFVSMDRQCLSLSFSLFFMMRAERALHSGTAVTLLHIVE